MTNLAWSGMWFGLLFFCWFVDIFNKPSKKPFLLFFSIAGMLVCLIAFCKGMFF